MYYIKLYEYYINGRNYSMPSIKYMRIFKPKKERLGVIEFQYILNLWAFYSPVCSVLLDSINLVLTAMYTPLALNLNIKSL